MIFTLGNTYKLKRLTNNELNLGSLTKSGAQKIYLQEWKKIWAISL